MHNTEANVETLLRLSCCLLGFLRLSMGFRPHPKHVELSDLPTPSLSADYLRPFAASVVPCALVASYPKQPCAVTVGGAGDDAVWNGRVAACLRALRDFGLAVLCRLVLHSHPRAWCSDQFILARIVDVLFGALHDSTPAQRAAAPGDNNHPQLRQCFFTALLELAMLHREGSLFDSSLPLLREEHEDAAMSGMDLSSSCSSSAAAAPAEKLEKQGDEREASQEKAAAGERRTRFPWSRLRRRHSKALRSRTARGGLLLLPPLGASSSSGPRGPAARARPTVRASILRRPPNRRRRMQRRAKSRRRRQRQRWPG